MRFASPSAFLGFLLSPTGTWQRLIADSHSTASVLLCRHGAVSMSLTLLYKQRRKPESTDVGVRR